MTDKDIIKSLPNMTYGGHYCAKCKYDNGKGDDRCGLKGCKIARYALDLITRQQAEIERLTANIKTLENIIKNSFLEKAGLNIDPLTEIKSEAVKEFARRLKCGVPQETGVIRCSDIDNLVKEMVGENNG